MLKLKLWLKTLLLVLCIYVCSCCSTLSPASLMPSHPIGCLHFNTQSQKSMRNDIQRDQNVLVVLQTQHSSYSSGNNEHRLTIHVLSDVFLPAFNATSAETSGIKSWEGYCECNCEILKCRPNRSGNLSYFLSLVTSATTTLSRFFAANKSSWQIKS